jgi:putative ABC transport system permease protein
VKYLPLIWAGLWRKRARTVLTLFSVATAFVLFGLLNGVTAGFDSIINRASDATRLRTVSRINISSPLPLAYRTQIASVPGVVSVTPLTVLLAYYRDPKNNIGNALAMDMSRFGALGSDYLIQKDQMNTMLHTPDGAIVGSELLQKYDWHVGDRVTLRSRVWTQKSTGKRDWTFQIVGTYKIRKDGYPDNSDFFVNYHYFDEARSGGSGTVMMYLIKVGDAAKAPQIAQRIDGLFRNSADETLTQSDRAYIRGQIDRIGNINFIVDAIVGAVLFTLLFLTGNTMMQSIRERIPELAVLKTYGFGNTAVTALVVGESLLLTLAAAAAGLGIAALAFPAVYKSLNIAPLPLPLTVVAGGFGIAVALALVSALPPVWRARRLKIVDALAGR